MAAYIESSETTTENFMENADRFNLPAEDVIHLCLKMYVTLMETNNVSLEQNLHVDIINQLLICVDDDADIAEDRLIEILNFAQLVFNNFLMTTKESRVREELLMTYVQDFEIIASEFIQQLVIHASTLFHKVCILFLAGVLNIIRQQALADEDKKDDFHESAMDRFCQIYLMLDHLQLNEESTRNFLYGYISFLRRHSYLEEIANDINQILQRTSVSRK